MAKESRNARFQRIANEAESLLSDLKEIQDEYQEWYDNLPENLQSSAVGEKLSAVCDLDIEGALETVSEAAGMDLPLGFGRD